MAHGEHANRFVHLAALALLLILLTPSAGRFTAPAFIGIALVLAGFALATSARRGRA